MPSEPLTSNFSAPDPAGDGRLDVASYLDIPWVEYGNSREGVDCVGLIDLVYREYFGIDDPWLKPGPGRYSYGPQGITGASKRREQFQTNFIQVKEPRFGDVVVVISYGVAGHVGMLIDDDYFLHVERGYSSYLAEWRQGKYAKKIDSFYRHNQLMHLNGFSSALGAAHG